MYLTKTEKKENNITTQKKHTFSEKKFHNALGIEGIFNDIGLYRGRTVQEIKQKVSPDIEEWYIKTIYSLKGRKEKNIRIELEEERMNIFSSRILKRILGLEGSIIDMTSDYAIKNPKYIITTRVV